MYPIHGKWTKSSSNLASYSRYSHPLSSPPRDLPSLRGEFPSHKNGIKKLRNDILSGTHPETNVLKPQNWWFGSMRFLFQGDILFRFHVNFGKCTLPCSKKGITFDSHNAFKTKGQPMDWGIGPSQVEPSTNKTTWCSAVFCL